MLIIEPADPRERGPRELIEASHALMREMFDSEDIYALDVNDLCAPNMRFFAAREGCAVLGTGALAVMEDHGEVKSMFTDPAARGKGVATALLGRIEDEAAAIGLTTLKLETGKSLEGAIRLYERCGFVHCGIFGDYKPNSTSFYMKKRIVPKDPQSQVPVNPSSGNR